jgi:hypothetical protein
VIFSQSVAFMWLTPHFERISHYRSYIIFRINFENVHRHPVLKRVHFSGPLCIYRIREHFVPSAKTCRLMLFRQVAAVYSWNNTKLINTMCGQNVGGVGGLAGRYNIGIYNIYYASSQRISFPSVLILWRSTLRRTSFVCISFICSSNVNKCRATPQKRHVTTALA